MSLVLAAFLALIGVQNPASAGTASIEGMVTRAGTSQPIENARVAVWGDRGPDFRATTDANGHFVVSNMPAGIFNIEVQAEGYLPNPSSNMRIRIGLSDRQRLRHDVVPFLSPDFLSLYENRSTSISVAKGATVTIAPLSLISP
jgi:hypothetical protein